MMFGGFGSDDLLALKREQNRHAEAMADKMAWKISRAPADGEYGSIMIPIPNSILEKLGWSSGDKISIDIDGDKLVLTKRNHDSDGRSSGTSRTSESNGGDR